MSKSEEEIRKALEGVLNLYDIKLEETPEWETSQKENGIDYSEMIGKTQAKLDELTEKAEEIYKRTGMTRDQLEAYASNPSNFTKEQWEALQKVKEACEMYKAEAHNQLPQFEQTAASRQRKKQPQRFAKKKHWIPS